MMRSFASAVSNGGAMRKNALVAGLYRVILISAIAPWCVYAIAQQPTQLTRFASSKISVANYDDNVYGRSFARLFADSRMKRLAIVVGNTANQAVIAAHVRWTWLD